MNTDRHLTTPSLLAGAAATDITPKAGTHLAGAVGLFRPARMALDPLYARALVLECGSKKLCIVSLDVTIITRQYSETIRQAAVERFGFEHDAVMVHAVQNHSAPPIGHCMLDDDFEGIAEEHAWLRGGDDSYSVHATDRAIEAMGAANDCLRPVCIGAGRGIEGRMAANRRAVKQDGTVEMPWRGWTDPLGPTWIRYIEGPIDPEVGVVCLRDESMGIVSLLLHYTCHPVHVYPRLVVSADWPGAWCREMASRSGDGCVPLVMNGACGNINPWDAFDAGYPNDHNLMGRTLAQMAEKVVESMDFEQTCALDWKVAHLSIPVREVEPERLEQARALLVEHPEPMWTDDTHTQVERSWIDATGLWSVHLCRERAMELDYEVQVLRIGDVALVGLPGEPFVEGQLRIKMASPARFTYVAHCCTHYVGYLPTKEAFQRGGHEVNTSYWSKLVPEALDMVVDRALGCLNEVYGRDDRSAPSAVRS